MGMDCLPLVSGVRLPEPKELFGIFLQGKSGGVGPGVLW